MEICGKCHIRIMWGECNCPKPTITLEQLRELVSGGDFEVTYGHPEGRTEEYTIDSLSMYGIGSSGFKSLPLEELDLTYIRSISKLQKVYRA